MTVDLSVLFHWWEWFLCSGVGVDFGPETTFSSPYMYSSCDGVMDSPFVPQ